jgi:nicotinamidase/pyrazinamidase
MKALIVVDAQNDFMPGGALAVTEGDEIIPVINELLKDYKLVIFTKDWHPADSLLFASHWPDKKPFDTIMLGPGADTLWPDHCVEGTPGADLHKDIKFENCKGNFYIFKKGLDTDSQGYSGFENTSLTDFLREWDVDEVVICGLATDYCVKNTALDAKKEGFEVTVYLPACRAISTDLTKTVKELLDNEISIQPTYNEDSDA